MISFYVWLGRFQKEDSPRGDLAQDSRADSDTKNTLQEWKARLRSRGACSDALKTLKECWIEYLKYEDSMQESILLKKYGITSAEYIKLLKKQKGVCAICGQPPINRRLAVDHCHKTKKIRGLLCGKCNVGLGYFKDDVLLLESASKYLL